MFRDFYFSFSYQEMGDPFEKLHLSVKFNNIYKRCVKAPGSKNSIGTLQKPFLSECLPILARKQPTNLADEETSSFSTAVGVRQNDINNDLVTDMQQVTQLEGLSTENLPDLQNKIHRAMDHIPTTPDDEEEVDDVTEIHSSPVKHSPAQRERSRTSGSSVTNNRDVTSAVKRRIDDGVVTLISSSDDEEDEGEIFSSPVKHTNAPGRQSSRKCLKSRERPEGRTAIKQLKKRCTHDRSQHSMDNHQIEEQQDKHSNRGKSPAGEMMKSKKSKGDRGSSSRIPSNYAKGKSKSGCSKVSSEQHSSKENESLDYENVTNDINYLKQEYKNQGHNFAIHPLVHCNIMPLSEALHRVNAPVKTKPKVLFGVGGLINSRNMNWHTVIDEG